MKTVIVDFHCKILQLSRQMLLVAAKFYFSYVTELQSDSQAIIVVYEKLQRLSDDT
jgi:hypothetical protein